MTRQAILRFDLLSQLFFSMYLELVFYVRNTYLILNKDHLSDISTYNERLS